MLVPLLLLLLPLVSLLSVEALICYDCLSKALAECSDGARASSFNTVTCQPPEKYCSTLLLNDTAGHQIVSRQCASKKDEGEQLKSFIRGALDKDVKVVGFYVCQSDMCNTHNPPDGVRPTTAAPAESNQNSGALPDTFRPAVILSLALVVAKVKPLL